MDYEHVRLEKLAVVDKVRSSALDGPGGFGIQRAALDHRPEALGDLATAAALEQGEQPSIDPLLGVVTTVGMKR